MTDGDWFEQRIVNDVLKAVAYVETLQIPDDGSPEEYPIWKSKISLAEQINHVMVAFYVWHFGDCSIFYVQSVKKNTILKLTEAEYINFIKGLKEKNNKEQTERR